VPASTSSTSVISTGCARNLANRRSGLGGSSATSTCPTPSPARRRCSRSTGRQTQKGRLIVDGRFQRGGLDPGPVPQPDEQPGLFTGPAATRTTTRRHSWRRARTWRCDEPAGRLRPATSWPAEFQLRDGPGDRTRTLGRPGRSVDVHAAGRRRRLHRGRLPGLTRTDGRWVIENEGVEPDITVDARPAEWRGGYDAQLMKAGRRLMKKIAEERAGAARPPFPKRPWDRAGAPSARPGRRAARAAGRGRGRPGRRGAPDARSSSGRAGSRRRRKPVSPVALSSTPTETGTRPSRPRRWSRSPRRRPGLSSPAGTTGLCSWRLSGASFPSPPTATVHKVMCRRRPPSCGSRAKPGHRHQDPQRDLKRLRSRRGRAPEFDADRPARCRGRRSRGRHTSGPPSATRSSARPASSGSAGRSPWRSLTAMRTWLKPVRPRRPEVEARAE